MVDSRQQVDSVTVNHCQPLSTTVNLKVTRDHVPPLSTTVNHEVDRSTEVDSAHRSTGSTGRQGHDGRQGRQQGLKLTPSLCAFTHRECKVQGCQDIVSQANHMIRATLPCHIIPPFQASKVRNDMLNQFVEAACWCCSIAFQSPMGCTLMLAMHPPALEGAAHKHTPSHHHCKSNTRQQLVRSTSLRRRDE